MQKILDHEIWEDMESPIFIYSSLAQSVERMTVNHDVVGSSPTRGAKNRHSSSEECRFYLLPIHSSLFPKLLIDFEVISNSEEGRS